MSAWSDYCNSLGSTVDVSKSVLMKKAFEAGLEAAAKECEKFWRAFADDGEPASVYDMEMDKAIRKLKESDK